MDFHATPELAVQHGYPQGKCRILHKTNDQNRSVVLAEISNGSYREAQAFLCTKAAEGWKASEAGTNFWGGIHEEQDLGIGIFASGVDPRVTKAKVRVGKSLQEIDVENGHLLAVAWAVKYEDWDPEVVDLYYPDKGWQYENPRYS